jgi:hypothetical protein
MNPLFYVGDIAIIPSDVTEANQIMANIAHGGRHKSNTSGSMGYDPVGIGDPCRSQMKNMQLFSGSRHIFVR